MSARTNAQRERRTARKMEEIALSNRMGVSTHGRSGRERILEEIQKRMRYLKKRGFELDGVDMPVSAHRRAGEINGLAISWAILSRPYDDTMEFAEKLKRREWRKCNAG